jgi:hypothetical protein
MRFVLAIILFSLFSEAQGQDFRLFHPNQDYIFSGGYFVIGCRIDSTKIINGKKVNYLPNYLIEKHSFSGSDSVWINGPSPFGNGFIENLDSSVSIFSNYNDTLHFDPHIPLEDTALLGERGSTKIYYYLEQEKSKSLLDTIAIVKSFRFIVIDSSGIVSNEYPNGQSLEIAENIGLSKSISFSLIFKTFDFQYPYPFSEESEEVFELNLIGVPFKNLGIYPLNPISIYDLDIGDQIHKESYTYHNYFAQNKRTRSLIQNERRCISKSETDSTILYKIRNIYRSYSDQNLSGYMLDTSYLTENDVVRNKFERFPLPGNFYSEGGYFYFNNDLIVNGVYEEREILDYPIRKINGAIFEYYLYHPLCDNNGYYLRGLGGPYVNECGNGTGYRHYKKLVYYKKGNIEFGTPLNIEELQTNYEYFRVYPNPFIDEINFEGVEPNEIKTIEVFDVTGKILLQVTPVEKHTLNLKMLPDGISFIKVNLKNGSSKNQKIIK